MSAIQLQQKARKSATVSARRLGETRLLALDRESGSVEHSRVACLADFFRSGDRLVVNDAATIPASLLGRHSRSGAAVEIRLLSRLPARMAGGSQWRAVIFGDGDWRTPTELRAQPPAISRGDRIELAGGLAARVLGVHAAVSERLLDIELVVRSAARSAARSAVEPGSGGVLGGIYRAGRPIQYSYLEKKLEPWDQQTLFSGPPAALEPPSAAFALTWSAVIGLRKKGVEVLTVTHGTGVSDTGDQRINALLPMPETSLVGAETQRRLLRAQSENSRIIAVGTGTVRALESWAAGETREGLTSLRIGPETKLRIVTGILTGMHDSGASHLDLLAAWRAPELLERGYREAQARGYLWHEYGDQCLLT